MKITRIVNRVLAVVGIFFVAYPEISMGFWYWWVTVAITLLCLEHGIEI